MTDSIAEVETLTAQQRDDLAIHWDEFADADPLSKGRDLDAFLRDMEMAGLAECVSVDDEALEDPFAYERGIEPDGMMWQLTASGSVLRAQLMGQAS